MGLTDLSPYGTGNGLKQWSLDVTIQNLTDKQPNNIVARAQRLLGVYGPYNNGKTNFTLLMTDLVYYVAEALFFWSGNVETIVSPFRAERIGSYSYDKGSRDPSKLRLLLENHEIIWPMMLHLRSLPEPLVISSRVVQVVEANPETGIRDYVDSYTNRTQRAIERRGIISDTESFNFVVYGDRNLGWSP